MDDQERVGDVTPTYEPTFHGRRSGLRARRLLIFGCPRRSGDNESSAQPQRPGSRSAGNNGAMLPFFGAGAMPSSSASSGYTSQLSNAGNATPCRNEDRQSVVSGKSVYARVVRGARRILQNKK